MIEFEQAAVTGRLEPITARFAERRIAVIGANGSGKSTFARMINGLVEPTSGRVLVDGLDTTRQGREVRRRVGFVFTDPGAQLVMPTVAEDVSLSLRRTHPDKTARAGEVDRLLAQFGLADLADRSVHALSGGQRQLVAIASVLAVAPSVLVADEPTTLLDLSNSRRVADLLLGLSQQLVLVTHDLELAQRCDRAVVIDQATMAFEGPAAEAVDHYRELVG